MLEIYSYLCPEWRGASMIIRDPDLTILFANESCKKILARRNPVGERNGKLTFDQPLLKNSICRKLNAVRESGQDQSAVTFLVPDDSQVLTAVIRQLPDLWHPFNPIPTREGMDQVRCVLVEFSHSIYYPDPGCLQSLSEAFGLTRAEAHDLGEIARGLSVSEIAEASGVAVSTVRQRIKLILAKTRCDRQQALICLVRSLCPNNLQRGSLPLFKAKAHGPAPQLAVMGG